ncbi:hypothetical protein P153DRAFT_358430 [Dothidotthia symphoricarpi CBS 119687]|uniref:Uncharacterized protein n=1 Tax=Dothidotthia symphoricarpi CBS 119687 TaxID=1392245 RepID=A0A6A6A8M2_9PLEO|nr:uncharacterized protein P153DRAFT_358430 [Dothidotthia symphoricarpi CBS 119687]KAF2127555.1 hypothetical protein P153DRAFT_358430 [Dothidotthia symphoricarpi CBS 119687]
MSQVDVSHFNWPTNLHDVSLESSRPTSHVCIRHSSIPTPGSSSSSFIPPFLHGSITDTHRTNPTETTSEQQSTSSQYLTRPPTSTITSVSSKPSRSKTWTIPDITVSLVLLPQPSSQRPPGRVVPGDTSDATFSMSQGQFVALTTLGPILGVLIIALFFCLCVFLQRRRRKKRTDAEKGGTDDVLKRVQRRRLQRNRESLAAQAASLEQPLDGTPPTRTFPNIDSSKRFDRNDDESSAGSSTLRENPVVRPNSPTIDVDEVQSPSDLRHPLCEKKNQPYVSEENEEKRHSSKTHSTSSSSSFAHPTPHAITTDYAQTSPPDSL